MEVYAYDAFCPKEVIEKDGVKALDSAEELYKTCQVVSLHIPATAETKNSINYALLKDMPKGAMLVNTARKEVINEAELIKLMEERADFKYITDIMPVLTQNLQRNLPDVISQLQRRWVLKLLKQISMPVLLPLNKL